jgi:hypothetical protein
LTVHRALDRLIFLECIPALSLVLVASSASDRLLVYRIERFTTGAGNGGGGGGGGGELEDGPRYAFQVEDALPFTGCGVPIKGVAVCEVASGERDDIRTTPHTSLQQSIRERQESTPSSLPCPPTLPHPSSRWRVYVLYADSRLAAFELTRPSARHVLDVANLFAP